jgi:hypothetical protein
MTRDQFEHAIRAAGSVLGVNEVLVIGSQALHGSITGECRSRYPDRWRSTWLPWTTWKVEWRI